MSYEVQIRHTADSGDGISVEALVEGEAVAHTFPKGMGFFDEPKNGRPRFVEKLEDKYEEKMKREGRVAQSALSGEEQKIHASKFENKVYGRSQQSFKPDDEQKSGMAGVELSEPEEIRDYLKENMAEGYLSDEEGINIDKFVDRYAELLEQEKNLEEVVREVYEKQVQ